MSRRRRSYNRSSRITADCCRLVCEQLEARRLLTTIITDTDPLTPTPDTVSFEYKAADPSGTGMGGDTVRVTVHGDVTAEFIFARVRKPQNDVVLGEYVGPTVFDFKTGKLVANPEQGRDLFHVYVAQSTIDSYIAIAKVPAFSEKNRPMQPFDGQVSLNINQLKGDSPTITADAGTGSIYLGARTIDISPDVMNEDKIPIRSAIFHGQGVAPLSAANKNGRLVAGLTVANGMSLGRFMFGGTVSGRVAVTGSMDTFYCGQLLTGVTEGQFDTGSPNDRDNFAVNGDLRNLLVKGSVGTETLPDDPQNRIAPRYLSGVDIQVGGKVGQIKTGSDYTGFTDIVNTPGPGLRTIEAELETRVAAGANRGSQSDFQNGEFGDNEPFFNDDTFENPQILGQINSRKTGNESMYVGGKLQWQAKTDDIADYFGVALMAGQTVSVRLSAPLVFVGGGGTGATQIPSDLHVGVFDPDKRLIASDFSDIGEDFVHQQTFSFTADRPGLFRIAVGYDPAFATPGLRRLLQPYNLRITGVGNMGLGGLSSDSPDDAILSTSSFFLNSRGDEVPGPATLQVENGDIGAIHTNGYIVTDDGFLVNTLGNLRDIDALSLGEIINGQIGAGPSVQTAGSVGLVRSSGTGGDNVSDFNSSSFVVPIIGGDLEIFDAANDGAVTLRINGSLGTFRAANLNTRPFVSSISVNDDGVGAPGIIDLIDIAGNLGTLGTGGPDISTNFGGNVRYMRVGGTAFRSRFFGGGSPEQTTYAQGQKAVITDDSGTNVTLTPTQVEVIDPLTGLPAVDPITGQPINNSGTLTVTTYPIAPNPVTGGGGGGSVILKVESTLGVTVDAEGTSAEIGQIVSTGTGAPLIADLGPDGLPNTGDEDFGPDGIPNTGDDPFSLDATSTLEDSIILEGAKGTIVDAFDIMGNGFNEIRNRTSGEIVNTNIGTVGRLEANTLGLARSSINPNLAVERIDLADNPGSAGVEGDVFPFLHAKNAIAINSGGDTTPAAVDVLARRGLGNLILRGVFQDIGANADNDSEGRIFEGINAPIYCEGQIRNLNIGEGILPSGTGEFAHSGVYVLGDAASLGAGGGRVEHIINQGLGSDIRGNIVTNSGIGDIALNGGSIINANIMVMESSSTTAPDTGTPEGAPTLTGADFLSSREFGGFFVIRQGRDLAGNELGNIDSINISGSGGIIGLRAEGGNIGDITVDGGFGIFNSSFGTTGAGRLGAFTATGFGFRGDSFEGGQSLQSLTAIGQGRANVLNYSPSVRLSDVTPTDPYSGQKFNELNDINKVLGTSAAMPVIRGASNAGVIDNTEVRVSRDVLSISASQLRSVIFAVPNLLGTVQTRDYIIGGFVTAGRMDTISIGGDASRFSFQVAGPIGLAAFGKSFRGTTSVTASGPAGKISTLIVKGSLYGNVAAAQGIGTIEVRKHVGSLSIRSAKNIDKFTVGGSLVSTAHIIVDGQLSEFIVAGDVLDGAIIEANPLVKKSVGGVDQGQYL